MSTDPFPYDPELDADTAPPAADFEPRVIPLAEIPSREPAWLWPDYIPAGMLTVLDGDPGAGKSLFLLDLAARVSRDGVMPDGSAGLSGHVIVITDEPLAEVVCPRLEAAGADIGRISVMQTVQTDDGRDVPFLLPRDVRRLRAIILRQHAQLLIFDPFTAFCKGDVTQTLRELALLANETGCAIVLSRHLAKNKCREPLYRGAGPLAIIAAVRAALLLARDPELPGRRVLAPYKNILGELAEARGFEVTVAASLQQAEPAAGKSRTSRHVKITWNEPSEWTAEQLLAPVAAEREQSLLNDACRLLEQATYFQPRDANALRREAHQLGISDMTLRRAKAALGLRSKRQGFGSKGTWYWYRPDDPMFGEFFEKKTVESGDTLQYRDRRPGDPLTFPTAPEARAQFTSNREVRRQGMLDDMAIEARLRTDWSQSGPGLESAEGGRAAEQEWENPAATAAADGDDPQLKEIQDLLAEILVAKGVAPDEQEWKKAGKTGSKRTVGGRPANELRANR